MTPRIPTKPSTQRPLDEQPFDLLTLWLTSLLVLALSVGLSLFFEWLFISTRPSFMDNIPWVSRVNVLLQTGAYVVSLMFIFAGLIYRLAILFKQNRARLLVLSLLPAFFLASSSLLLVDNFIYTVWKIGISDSAGIVRLLYLLGFLGACVLWVFEMARLQAVLGRMIQAWDFKHRQILFFASLASLLVMSLPYLKMPEKSADHWAGLESLNVILVSADGLNANHMSIYGYRRETTPFLDSIKDELFISQNHFANSGNTSGAITSLLTSKYPSNTRVLYPPDILRGEDARQSLPAMLKAQGYYSAQFSIDHYADAKDLNFVDGFDEIMGERMRGGFSLWKPLNQRFPENGRLLLMEIEDRLLSRMKHLFFIEPMSNTFVQITMRSQDFEDMQKVEDTLNLLEARRESVFVHLHWMGTHGSKYYPQHNTFSAEVDRSAQKAWDPDLYDDSILDFDAGLEALITGIAQFGEAEPTLIVITSDHGQGFSTRARIPLLIWGETDLLGQEINLNTQALDVAPTILDLLEIPKPAWMMGTSILQEGSQGGAIIGMGTKSTQGQGDYGWALDERRLKPPFYQFDYITLVDCDRFYTLNLEDFSWKLASVPSYKTKCEANLRLSSQAVLKEIVQRLQEDGFRFDPNKIPEPAVP